MSVASKLTAIADEIRRTTYTTEKLTLDRMKDSITNVFNEGKIEGITEGYVEGWDDGAQDEYDFFWDNHPIAKAKCPSENLFSGEGWNDITFRPKYNIVPYGSCYMIFKSCAVTDLVERLKECGNTIDFGQATSFTYALYQSKLTHIGEIPLTNSNFTKSTSHTLSMFCSATALHTVDKIIVNDMGTTLFASDMFKNALALTNITFDGVIGKSIDFQWCPLSKASILNIVEHLSSTATGQTLTLNLKAVDAAFETLPGTNDGSASAEFGTLISTKLNWSIILV